MGLLKHVLPSGLLIGILLGAGAGLTLLVGAGMDSRSVDRLADGGAIFLLAILGIDAGLGIRGWQCAPLAARRRLPSAFAVGRRATVSVTLENPGSARCRGRYFELHDPNLGIPGMPMRFDVGARRTQTLAFDVMPSARGRTRFAGGQILWRSRLGLLDWNLVVGSAEVRRIFPNFADQAAPAWVGGERRLPDIGIKSVRRRGAGTDFDQLVEYRAGDPIRHIDWKATLTHHRPITRKYRDDRDQRVVFLLDCGRRMRADDTEHGIGGTHFDQALNALMVLAYVALRFGDAVGAMTFGTPPADGKYYAPRKGRQSLNALLAELGDVEPTPTFSDYARSAALLLSRERKRALVVMVTNCRDEDAPGLNSALSLLRSRHRVVLANLREEVVGRIARQPLRTLEDALEIAAALDYERQRTRMLQKFAIGGALTIDCEPRRLGIELINKYTLLKRAGAI